MKEFYLDHRDIDEVWQESNRLWQGMGRDMMIHRGGKDKNKIHNYIYQSSRL